MRILGYIIKIQRRTLLQPYRGQLRRITHKDKLVASVLPNVRNQVIQQVSAPKNCTLHTCTNGNEGSLIHNIDGILALVEIEPELGLLVGEGLLPVNLLVDSLGLNPGIIGKHFGRPSGRCQQHTLLLELLKDTDKG